MTNYDSTAVTTQPKTVLWSFRLYIIGAILGIVGIILTLVLLPASIDAAVSATTRAAQGQSTSGLDVESVARGAAIGGAAFGIALSVLLVVLTIVFARKMRQGKNWARIVLLVFAVLQVAGVLSAVGVGALQFLVVIAAAVLSFLPASNAWFRAMKPVTSTTV